MSIPSTPWQDSSREEPDRNLALELVRVTEAAAIVAGRWVGRGDKNSGEGGEGRWRRWVLRLQGPSRRS